MATGLSVSRIINVTVNLSPLGAQFANFNALVIVGDSNVIDVGERIRSYNDISGVAADFSTTDPEYLAASLFFSQSPQPTQLYIGRWAQTATSGLLKGGILTTSEQELSLWTAITTGSFEITIDATLETLSALDFSSETNLNGVASVITTALSGGVCTWDGEKFIITSSTTGTSSTVSYAESTGSGTDISAMLKFTSSTASPPVDGVAAETALEAVTALDSLSTTWYGIMFASENIVDADHLAIAAYIQATTHVYGVSTTSTTLLSSTVTDDIASELSDALYTRSFVQYSQIEYVTASFFGRAFTTNFSANNSVITLMFKQEPGVNPEDLTAAQADTLIAKRCNFFVNYNNGTAILQNGVMSGPAFFDEIHATDALANALEVNLWNALYTSATKIPQTDAGHQQLGTIAEATCEQYVSNGTLAPGTWTTGGFGDLDQGDFVSKGYYVYIAPVASQADADRAARKSVPIQVAAKLAGAIHSADVIVNVNR